MLRPLTLKASEAQSLTTETLIILHSVNYNRPTQDVRKDKYVRLLQTRTRLERERDDGEKVRTEIKG